MFKNTKPHFAPTPKILIRHKHRESFDKVFDSPVCFLSNLAGQYSMSMVWQEFSEWMLVYNLHYVPATYPSCSHDTVSKSKLQRRRSTSCRARREPPVSCRNVMEPNNRSGKGAEEVLQPSWAYTRNSNAHWCTQCGIDNNNDRLGKESGNIYQAGLVSSVEVRWRMRRLGAGRVQGSSPWKQYRLENYPRPDLRPLEAHTTSGSWHWGRVKRAENSSLNFYEWWGLFTQLARISTYQKNESG